MSSLAVRSHECVRPWALHIIHEAQTRSVQRTLRANFAVLEREIKAIGADWRLDEDGRLTLNGRPMEGRDDVVDAVKRAAGGVATIFAGDTRIATNVMRPDGTRAVGTKLAPGPARDAVIGRGEGYRGVVDILGVPHMTVYEPIREASGRPAGILFVGVALAEAEVSADRLLREVLLAGLAVVPMACALGWSALRLRLWPRREPAAGQPDQLGAMGRGIKLVRDEALQALEAEKRVAATRAAQEARQEEVSRLTREFGLMASRVVAELERSAKETRGAATSMADTAERTRADMKATAGDAETSSRSLVAVSAATDQLTASVGEISRQVTVAMNATGDAVARAHATGVTVQGLSEAAGQISEIVLLISEIASKTNLLALNATIEAARAGEAGKGFAVVANEVKQLAAQTAQATSRIGVQVAAIQSATGEAVAAVRGVTAAIGQVSKVAGAIAAAVEQQGAATREIAAKVQGIAEVTDKAAGAMRDVCATAEQSGTTSRAVVDTADQVAGQSGSLRAEVDRFLDTIRAA